MLRMPACLPEQCGGRWWWVIYYVSRHVFGAGGAERRITPVGRNSARHSVRPASMYKTKHYIKQTLIKAIQMQVLNNIEIVDSRTGYYIKLPFISLSSTKSAAPDYMVKTIFNNLGNDQESNEV